MISSQKILHTLAVAVFLVPSLVLAQSSSIVPAATKAHKQHQLEDFIREDKFKGIAVSPKGTYIAVKVPRGDKTVLLILKAGEPKPISQLSINGKKSHVDDVIWASDERLIYTAAVKDQLIENPRPTGEIWAVNADGSKQRQLNATIDAGMGARAGGKQQREIAWIQPIADTPGDDDTIVAAVYTYGNIFTTVERVNINSGSRTRLSQAPIRNAQFTLDNKANPRFALGYGTDNIKKLFYRRADSDKWELFNDQGPDGILMTAMGFSADDSIAYLQSNEVDGPDSVIAYNTITGKRTIVVRHLDADPTRFINAVGKSYPIGVLYSGSTPTYEYFDPSSEDAKAHRSVTKAFPGQVVLVGNETTVKGEVVLRVYGDREPSVAYVYNQAQKRISPILYSTDWLDPNTLSPMRDMSFEARDKRRIPVLLTVPQGSGDKPLPLVIYPHGGPFGLQDSWGYNYVVQLLAAHGYAVLQVNYRGSSGYGRDHQIAGHKQWGLKMQDDLTDATRWAVAQGIADKDRICIYGASYGGYAALMGAVKEPGLYKCAVGQVGVYDLGRVKSEDSLGNDYLRNFFAETMNDGDLRQVSPNYHAAKIRIPILLSAGHEDEIAPVEHTELMEAALKEAGVPVETIYFKTEGHGIYKLEHRREFYGRLLTFLHKHIGGREPVIVATTEKK